MLITSKKEFFFILIVFSTVLFNFNEVNGIQIKVGVKQHSSLLSSNSTNSTVECAYPGPENNMYITIVENGSVPVSGAIVSGFVDYACGSQAIRPFKTLTTSSDGTVPLSCSYCNTFGPYNITITENSHNSSFYIKPAMKYLGQISWALISLTKHSYSLKEYDGSKCQSFSVSFSNNQANFYCPSQTNSNTANYYGLSLLVIPLYAMVRNRKKK